MLQIIAGRHRGRRLEPQPSVRPTAARAREAVFDILAHGRFAPGAIYDDALVLDAFAGTGAMGLEALSRGARFATFMEKDRAARQALIRTLAAWGETQNSAVVAADALKPPRAAGPAGLAFLDPPYGEPIAAPALAALAASGWLAADALVVLELASRTPFAPPDGFALLDERAYGAARILFLRREPR
jgi:16S rRNA (guanine966-N2)-methyltransferase